MMTCKLWLNCEKRHRAHNHTAAAAGHPSGEAFRSDANLGLDSTVGTLKTRSLYTTQAQSDWSFNHTIKLLLWYSKN